MQNSGVRLISNKNEGLISEKSMVLKCKNNNDKKSTLQDYFKHFKYCTEPRKGYANLHSRFLVSRLFLFSTFYFFAIFFSWHFICRVFLSRLFLSTVFIAACSETQSIAKKSGDIVVTGLLPLNKAVLPRYLMQANRIDGCFHVRL